MKNSPSFLILGRSPWSTGKGDIAAMSFQYQGAQPKGLPSDMRPVDLPLDEAEEAGAGKWSEEGALLAIKEYKPEAAGGCRLTRTALGKHDFGETFKRLHWGLNKASKREGVFPILFEVS